MTVADALRIVDANSDRQSIERAFRANVALASPVHVSEAPAQTEAAKPLSIKAFQRIAGRFGLSWDADGCMKISIPFDRAERFLAALATPPTPEPVQTEAAQQPSKQLTIPAELAQHVRRVLSCASLTQIGRGEKTYAEYIGWHDDAAAGERFFMDHGTWHDRETGKHLFYEGESPDAATVNEAWAALSTAGVERDGVRTLSESIAKLAALKSEPSPAPVQAHAGASEALTDVRLDAVIDKWTKDADWAFMQNGCLVGDKPRRADFRALLRAFATPQPGDDTKGAQR